MSVRGEGGGEAKVVVAEEDRGAFGMQLQTRDFLAEQERIQVRKDEKR